MSLLLTKAVVRKRAYKHSGVTMHLKNSNLSTHRVEVSESMVDAFVL